MRDTLLVIDDSELDLAILNEIFKHLFRVECSSDPRRALSFLRKNHERVCAILLDICLERRGAGFTVLHQLQGHLDTAGVPVILITTDANEKDVRASGEGGAVDFLVKPGDPHTVQERVCTVIRASWPPETTILDHPEEETPPEASAEDDAGDEALFPEPLSLPHSRLLCRRWSEKLAGLCRLRPVLDMEEARQLCAITTILAQSYVRLHPDGDLTEESAELIGMAAMFCDIGLLGLPDALLEKAEAQERTEETMEDYYQHTTLGQQLFAGEEKRQPLFRYAREIAQWHHKNADGTGYPARGDGNRVPLSAQLVHTALQIQQYLHYYQGCSDRFERMFRALQNEAGTVITRRMAYLFDDDSDALAAALRTV